MRRVVVLGIVTWSALAMAQAEDLPAHQRARRPTEQPAAPDVRRSRITLGPTLLAFGTLPLEYERAVTHDMSFFAGGRVTFPAAGALVGIQTWGVGSVLGLRFFPGEAPAPQGLWLGVETQAGYFRTTVGPTGALSEYGFHAALVSGYTFVSSMGLTISSGLGAGVGYSSVGLFATGPGVVPAFSMHLNAGYAF